jgi:hypothetical protein
VSHSSFACNLFCALSLGLFIISNANPACSCVYICKFQFHPIHPPSRRLSHIICQKRRALSTIKAKAARLRALTSCSARWPTSRTISHAAALDPWPSRGGGGAEAPWIEPGHMSVPDPGLGHDTPFHGTLLWAVQSSLGGVRTLSNGFGLLYSGGLGRAHRGPVPSGPNGVVSENATLTAHKIPLRLFSARQRVTAQASCLYTVVRGTPNPGYRHSVTFIRG